MRTGKILGLVVGGLIAVVVVVLLAVWLLVNPNDYKPRIAAAVKQATGRELVLSGDIKLSVFPWIALELGPASLGNPAGFAEQPFVSFQHAAIRAKVLPLLAKRLEIGRIDLDGLDLRLLKNAQGKGNWQGFGKAQEPQTAQTASDGSSSAEALQGLAGINVTKARLSYENLVIENAAIETGAFASKGLVPVSVHFDVNRGIAGESANFEAKLDVSADLDQKIFKIAALNLNGVVTQAGNNRPIKWNVTSPEIALNLNTQTLNLAAFDVTLAGAHLTGSAQGTNIVDSMTLTGSFALAPLVVREFLPRLGLTAPRMRDPRALSQVAASSNFQYGGNAAKLDKLRLTLDDTHLTGELEVVNLENNAIKFALAVDQIDVDRYLAPEGSPAAAKVDKSADAHEAPAKPLEANGTLAIGAVQLAPLDLTEVQVTVASSDKVLHVYPLLAHIDGGQYSGNLTLDSRTAVPALSMDEHLTGIDIGKLMAGTARNIHLTGHGNVTLKGTARGVGAESLMKTLTGHLETNVADGSVEGFDLGYQLGRAEALIRRQALPNAQNTKRTRFDVLKMSADINDGVATTKDLTIASAALKVTGQGSANLVTKALDFSLLADTLRTAGTTPIQIPVKITGTASDPTVRPDIEALAKGQLKQKVQDLLQDKLKGLFGKP